MIEGSVHDNADILLCAGSLRTAVHDLLQCIGPQITDLDICNWFAILICTNVCNFGGLGYGFLLGSIPFFINLTKSDILTAQIIRIFIIGSKSIQSFLPGLIIAESYPDKLIVFNLLIVLR